jgi:hypothetical protein
MNLLNLGRDLRDGNGPQFWGGVKASGNYHFDFTILHFDVIINGQATPNGHYVLGDSSSQRIWNSNPSLTLGGLLDISFFRIA